MNIASRHASAKIAVSGPDIPALTSLRFFACAMIVALHAEGHFGIPKLSPNYSLGAGVSFFFVLSGFILTYRYPTLSGRAEVIRFFRARIARLWPAHVAAIAFVLWTTFGTYELDGDMLAHLVINLTMVITWVPSAWFTVTYNGPSWSIATEFFFYLMFPLLIFNFSRTWWWKLILSFLAAMLMLAATSVFDVSEWLALYQNPLARLFEFVTGMCAALAWQTLPRLNVGRWTWTAAEVAAIGFFVFCVNVFSWQELSNNLLMWWYASAHTAIPVAFLIFVIASGDGFVRKALGWPVLVFLGEISYSTYLIHIPLLGIYWTYLPIIKTVPAGILGVAFFSTLLTLSYLIWVGIEKPLRKVIVGKRKRPAYFKAIDDLRRANESLTSSR